MSCLTHTLRFRSPSLEVQSLSCFSAKDTRGFDHEYEASKISIVRSGVFARVIRGQSLLADGTQALFVNRGDVHRFVHPLDGGDTCTVLVLSPSTMTELLWHFDRRATRFPVDQRSVSSHVWRLHHALLRAVHTDRPVERLTTEDLALELCAALVALAYGPSPFHLVRGRHAAARQRRIVEHVRLAVNAHLRCPPGLSDLAQAVDCSPFHLSRVFNAHVGMTLRSYVGRLRAAEGARRIMEGANEFTSIAQDLGYYDHSHFTNAFRGAWGVSPQQFRRDLGRATVSKRNRAELL